MSKFVRAAASLDIPIGEPRAPLAPEGVCPVQIAEATVSMFGDDGKRSPRLVFLQFSSEGLFIVFSLEPFECIWSGRDLLRVRDRWEHLSGQYIPVADLMRLSLGRAEGDENGGDL